MKEEKYILNKNKSKEQKKTQNVKHSHCEKYARSNAMLMDRVNNNNIVMG